jgi:hypothetical protein
VRFEFSAPPGCSDRGAYLDQVRRRTTRFREATAEESARVFSVTLSVFSDEAEAVLEVRSVDGASSRRTISGQTCDEVMRAVALVTAVLIDPRAEQRSAEPAEVRRPVEMPVSPTSRVERREPPVVRQWHWAVGFSGSITSAIAPKAVVSPRPFVELATERPAADYAALRLSATRASSGTTTTEFGTARFTWTAARADACFFWGLPAARTWDFEPCATFDAGRLEGSGSEAPDARTVNVTWLAPGLLDRVRFRGWAPLLIDLEAGAFFPLSHYRFYFEPGTTAHQVPTVGAHAAIGVGLFF